MPLTYFERKACLPHGAVSRVAEEEGCAISKVSANLSGTAFDRAIQTKLAALMIDTEGKPVTVDMAFGPERRSLRRSKASA
jgi:hypothetical protein